MHVREPIRLDRGGDDSTAGSGLGAVRALAMLQLFAPRSSVFGKDLFISCKATDEVSIA
jgi:hypothetical protein